MDKKDRRRPYLELRVPKTKEQHTITILQSRPLSAQQGLAFYRIINLSDYIIINTILYI